MLMEIVKGLEPFEPYPGWLNRTPPNGLVWLVKEKQYAVLVEFEAPSKDVERWANDAIAGVARLRRLSISPFNILNTSQSLRGRAAAGKQEDWFVSEDGAGYDGLLLMQPVGKLIPEVSYYELPGDGFDLI